MSANTDYNKIEKVLSKIPGKELKEFAWLLSYVKGVMGLSSVVDGVIKDGIRKLIAEHPDKVYMRNYLGTVL